MNYYVALGHYAYIEASRPRVKGQNAILQTPMMRSGIAVGKCLRFWYHMKGKNMGTLKVGKNSKYLGFIVWTVSSRELLLCTDVPMYLCVHSIKPFVPVLQFFIY